MFQDSRPKRQPRQKGPRLLHNPDGSVYLFPRERRRAANLDTLFTGRLPYPTRAERDDGYQDGEPYLVPNVRVVR
jgi:hypothetical protein